ncbi:MAG: transporter [Pseudomonadales bacterium]|nr:transporter [Pseudomonadales bacterium]
MQAKHIFSIALLLLSSLLGLSHAKSPVITVSSGYIVGDREGDLGIDTEVDIIPISIAYKTGAWKFKLSTAHLKATGPGDIFTDEYDDEGEEDTEEGSEPDSDIGDDDDVSGGETYIEIRDREGMGDTFFTINYSPSSLKTNYQKLTLGYKVKAPTGDEDEGLSSGEWDHHFFLRGYYRINRFMMLGRLGYQFMGDTDERDYNNRLFAGAGLVYIVNRQFSFGSQYFYKQASTDSRDDLQHISLIVQARPNKDWSFAANFNHGLSDSALDRQIGIQISRRFR